MIEEELIINTIEINRGDTFSITFENEEPIFIQGSVINFYIMKKGDCSTVLLHKNFTIENEENEGKTFSITMQPEDTKSICPVLKSGSKTFWYEIELISDGVVTTLKGYDKEGPKELVIYPEAVKTEEGE